MKNNGHITMEEYLAKRQKTADAQMRKITALRKRGLSYGQIAGKIGKTRSSVAGICYRAKSAGLPA